MLEGFGNIVFKPHAESVRPLTKPNTRHLDRCVVPQEIDMRTDPATVQISVSLGKSHRLPDSLLSDDAIDAGLLSENPNADFQRAEDMRRAATNAWAADDSRGRLQRAFRARHRTPQHYHEYNLYSFGGTPT